MQSVPMTPILNGSDPLTELTRDLDDRLRADAYRQRGPSPWQVSVEHNHMCHIRNTGTDALVESLSLESSEPLCLIWLSCWADQV